MKPIESVKEILGYDKDSDRMYLVKNSVVEDISNRSKIAVGLFPKSCFAKSSELRIYSFDSLLYYALEKDKPLIGVVEWPYYSKGNKDIYEVPFDVTQKVIRSGGIPVGIFPTQVVDFQHTRLANMPLLTEQEKEDLDDILGFMDGIIKPGTFKAYEFDKYIHSKTVSSDMPYFGICGGMQIMTYPEGKLENTNPNRDVTDLSLHTGHDDYAHSIKIARDSKLFDILKADEIMVNSKHRKCLPESALTNFKVSAIADDQTVEAIEIPNKAFQIGVQWHPEFLDDIYTDMLFGSFIEESKIYSKRK